MTAASSRDDGLCERDRTNFSRYVRWAMVFGLFYLLAVLTLGPAAGGIGQMPAWSRLDA